jgi:hypothetical protein
MVRRLHADAINEGPASPASSRRLCGTLSPLGAPAARCTRRQACLASCAHRSVRRHAVDALAASGLLACRRPRCCTRGDGRAHRAPAPRAPIRCATGRACAGRRGRRLLRAGRTAARRALSGWAGWARARRRRRRMHVAAVDGRQRRAIGCAPLALLNYAAARAPRDAWVAVAEAWRAGRRCASDGWPGRRCASDGWPSSDEVRACAGRRGRGRLQAGPARADWVGVCVRPGRACGPVNAWRLADTL